MRVRQIFLAAGTLMMVCGCSGGDADEQIRRELMEKAEDTNRRRSI